MLIPTVEAHSSDWHVEAESALQAVVGFREQTDHRELLLTCPPDVPHNSTIPPAFKNKIKYVFIGLWQACKHTHFPFPRESLAGG